MVFHDFEADFWNERYSASSNYCRRARTKISYYINYFAALTDPQFGVLTKAKANLQTLIEQLS